MSISRAAALIAAMAVSGCKPEWRWEPNQEKRQDIFFRCLNAAGEHGVESFSTTKSNAMGDVVRACERSAYYLALEKVFMP